MGGIRFGCVGDDFSGASDAASFLAEQGIKTLFMSGIPEGSAGEDADAAVIALKIRTERREKAAADALEAFGWLKEQGARQLYYKYCSTFDSTREGNIGPITDAVLERYDIPYTVICPALPVNGRTVLGGRLLVSGVPLHETHMKDHPLTPMWDADISRLMAPQGKYPCMNIGLHTLMSRSREELFRDAAEFGRGKEHFYIIPDCVTDEHAQRIIDVFGGLPFLTGGSGLMPPLGQRLKRDAAPETRSIQAKASGRALILAGSCAAATLGQIGDFIGKGGYGIKIDPVALMAGMSDEEAIWQAAEAAPEDTVLVYSSDTLENVREAQKLGAQRVSERLEHAMGVLAARAAETGFSVIVAAGGETSGAVAGALGFGQYLVGRSIAPGVPVMTPVQRPEMRVVFKSGNFGQSDFFTRAVRMAREM